MKCIFFFCFWVSEQQKTRKNQPSGVEATDPYSKICKEKIKVEKKWRTSLINDWGAVLVIATILRKYSTIYTEITNERCESDKEKGAYLE